MAIEAPIASSIIAQHQDVVENLAAVQFGYGLVLLFEGPIIFLLSTSAALVKGVESYEVVRKFSFIISACLTAILCMLFATNLFTAEIAPRLQLSPSLTEQIQLVCSIMFLAPFAVGMRRFYQGCLIAIGKTKLVAVSTIMRIAAMSVIGFGLPVIFTVHISGAGLAAMGVIGGMIAECLTVRFFTRRYFSSISAQPNIEQQTLAKVSSFYYPLALNGLLNLSQGFLLGLFLSQSFLPNESLGLWQVVTAINLLLFSFPYSYQEAILAALRKNIPEGKLRDIGASAALVLVSLYLAAIFSPLYTVWLHDVVGLTPWLQELAFFPFCLGAITVGFVFLSNAERGFFIAQKRTKIIGITSIVDLGTMVLSMVILSQYFHVIGLYAAALSALIARIITVTILRWSSNPRQLKKLP